MHGPYPAGNPSAQPSLDSAFESAESGAVDQTMRMIIKPDLWGRVVRLRFANTFGTRRSVRRRVRGPAGRRRQCRAGTNRPVTFADGKSKQLTLAPGASAWSDPVTLPWVGVPGDPLLAGRKLAVSFHVGASGPMTWHAKALTTSYLSPPRSGSRGDDDDTAFPYSTTSWFFLDRAGRDGARRTRR